MNMKTLLKALSLICLSSFALAKNDCRTLMRSYKDGDEDNVIVDCSNNSNGELSYLHLYNNFDLSENDFNKIFSYSTISKLTYAEDKGKCHPLLNRISGLSNLEDLMIQSYKGHIEKGILKDLNNLWKLTIQYTYLSNDNINEIISLPNLRELSFYNMEFESDISFKPLKKATNIQSVAIKDIVINQSLFNEISSLSNLQELKIDLFSSKLSFLATSFDSVKNLTSLTVLEFNSDLPSVPEFVYSIPNLKKLIYKIEYKIQFIELIKKI
ncbi:hypothetical protein H8356DRAFT_1285924 [Neocallimastix lanati (nom. inval.)]|uniref:L domain-like protein n=1 Tax=Neocallimastix californiae TaxID=1754190 RepID=A0A1Y2F468_9FUNG|nr:hypothetical protein H8356DRAFT_1285924 [Neocallimastix sp. JGI-2020a]ORY78718.1 hypothetical protein LY90DRAFT_500907 [Neocallimastix californiae]|eukprot:ORY78718.1 hypothetical protein LY90DRAFT_500907 [Neocallimastix californiae]